MTRIVYMVLAMFFVACGSVQPVPDPPVPGATCEAACARGAKLGCSWARPTELGASCLEVCANASVVPWPAECLSKADTCDVTCP